MSDPKLREARIAEARRRAEANIQDAIYEDALVDSLYDLIDSDWRPEPEVDAVTLAAREWMKKRWPGDVGGIKAGRYDVASEVSAFRAGHAHGQANHPDTVRMDWLAERWVKVDGKDGNVFIHRIAHAEPLRTKIDRAMGGGE